MFDFVTRQKIQGQTLNLFIVEQLPIVPPERYAEVRFVGAAYLPRGDKAPPVPVAMRWIFPISRVSAGPLAFQLIGSVVKRRP